MVFESYMIIQRPDPFTTCIASVRLSYESHPFSSEAAAVRRRHLSVLCFPTTFRFKSKERGLRSLLRGLSTITLIVSIIMAETVQEY